MRYEERETGRHAVASAFLTLAAVAALAIGGCGAGTSRTGQVVSHPPAHSHPDPRQWLTVNAAKHTVQITLVAAYNDVANGLNIDGSYKSALMFVVPVGWKASVRWVNDSEEDDYACVLTPSPGTHRHRGVAVETLHPSQGIGPGESFAFPFQPTGPALYRVIAVRGRPPTDVATGMTVALKVVIGGRPHGVWLR